MLPKLKNKQEENIAYLKNLFYNICKKVAVNKNKDEPYEEFETEKEEDLIRHGLEIAVNELCSDFTGIACHCGHWILSSSDKFYLILIYYNKNLIVPFPEMVPSENMSENDIIESTKKLQMEIEPTKEFQVHKIAFSDEGSLLAYDGEIYTLFGKFEYIFTLIDGDFNRE